MATAYKRQRWTTANIYDLAAEEDTKEINPITGNLIDLVFHYEVMYAWMSAFVHGDINSMHRHVIQAGSGQAFKVRSSPDQVQYGELASVNVVTCMAGIMTSVYRMMSDPEPKRAGKYAEAIVRHMEVHHRKW